MFFCAKRSIIHLMFIASPIQNIKSANNKKYESNFGLLDASNKTYHRMVNNHCIQTSYHIQNSIDRNTDVNSSTVRVFMQLFARKIVLKVHAQHKQNEITQNYYKI